MKPIDKLLTTIPNLSPVEFAGLARLLGIKLIEIPEEGEPRARSFTEVFADVLDKFEHSNRATKRQILQLISKSKKEAADASNS